MIHTLNLRTDRQVQFKDITHEIRQLVETSGITEGTIQAFIPHTTAAVTINENADPDVVTDMIQGLNKLVPQKDNYRHLEGNSAAHIKSSLIGTSKLIIIHQGKLLLGTWQGIYFCEFDGPRSRKVHIKIIEG